MQAVKGGGNQSYYETPSEKMTGVQTKPEPGEPKPKLEPRRVAVVAAAAVVARSVIPMTSSSSRSPSRNPKSREPRLVGEAFARLGRRLHSTSVPAHAGCPLSEGDESRGMKVTAVL